MWTDGTLVSFDLETTGTDPETARIVTASVVVIDGTTGKYETHEWLADPDVDIPAEATVVHGITTAYAREHGVPARTVIRKVWQTIAAECSPAPLIAYNAAYDLTVLDREMRRHYGRASIFERPIHVIDPLVLDRHLDRYRKGKRTLSAVSAHYGVPISEDDAHGSTADALCAARVAWTIGRRFPGECADLAAMQDMQRRAHLEWADHFGEYLRSKGQVDDVSRDWPMRPYVAEAVTA